MKTSTLDFLSTKITVVRDVAWMDERPQCRHLIASWRAGQDVGSRCENYGVWRHGRPEAGAWSGYCPINGGICAMEDPSWVFEPGWDKWAQWQAENHDYITMDVWPGFKAGMLGAYLVSGDCMAPTYQDGDPAIARLGRDDFADGAACIISRGMHGLPVRGKYLKRLDRIGDDKYLITADNPSFEPRLVPAETVDIVAVVLEDVEPEAVLDQLAVVHEFDGDGCIVPRVRAIVRLTSGF